MLSILKRLSVLGCLVIFVSFCWSVELPVKGKSKRSFTTPLSVYGTRHHASGVNHCQYSLMFCSQSSITVLPQVLPHSHPSNLRNIFPWTARVPNNGPICVHDRTIFGIILINQDLMFNLHGYRIQLSTFSTHAKAYKIDPSKFWRHSLPLCARFSMNTPVE